jgi:hypothetical protein
MTLDNYKLQLEQLLEDNDQSWSSSVIGKLTKRANQLQFEADFSLSDIYEELEEIIPESHKDDDEVWYEIVQEFASFINDEKEQKLDDDDELTIEDE